MLDVLNLLPVGVVNIDLLQQYVVVKKADLAQGGET
jgi:hypothetical protein